MRTRRALVEGAGRMPSGGVGAAWMRSRRRGDHASVVEMAMNCVRIPASLAFLMKAALAAVLATMITACGVAAAMALTAASTSVVFFG